MFNFLINNAKWIFIKKLIKNLFFVIIIQTKKELLMKIKSFSRDFHIYVSVFFLPMALLFAITGVAYIFGIHNDVLGKKQTWSIEKNIPKENQLDFLINYMMKNDIPFPKELNPRKDRNGGVIIGTSNYSLWISSQNNITTIQSLKRSFLGNMLMLHFAKGKWFFDVLSVGFGICLVLFYISGVVMTAFVRNKRKQILISLGLGIVITLIVGYLSV